jgi:hypothetical protein
MEDTLYLSLGQVYASTRKTEAWGLEKVKSSMMPYWLNLVGWLQRVEIVFVWKS